MDRAGGSLDRCAGPPATMQVTVRLFALAKERAGRSEVELELADPATVGDLRRRPASGVPQLGPLCAERHDRRGRGICLR